MGMGMGMGQLTVCSSVLFVEVLEGYVIRSA